VVSFTSRSLYLRVKSPEGWVDPRAGLDDVENRKFLTVPGLEFRTLGRYTDYAIPAPILCEVSGSILWLGNQAIARRVQNNSDKQLCHKQDSNPYVPFSSGLGAFAFAGIGSGNPT
jgi:hypothetical protein